MSRRRGAAPRTGGLELELFTSGHEPSVDGPRHLEKPAADGPRPDAATVIESMEELGDRFPGASAGSAIPVSALTATAKDVVESAFLPIWVRGEVSDFKTHRNGHWYFCLRDATAQIRCVVWSRDRRGIPAPPDDGMQIVALGQLTVYPARGEMQLMVRRMEAEGDGLWRKALDLTRARLAADGLLDDARKRPIPRHPRRIAVVTSPDGAALHDVVAVLRRRAPWVEVVVVPTAVQGDGAPEQIVAALDRVARWRDCDVVIVGRGGGAREDLWAFNDERVARAVAACPIPTISAVGHEVDITICDLVADLRAPTPSAAAEAAVQSRGEVASELRSLASRLHGAMTMQADGCRQRVRDGARDLASLTARIAERRRLRLGALAGRLQALSPLATLARGYAVARGEEGGALTSVAHFAAGERFELQLRDGIVRARVDEVVTATPASTSSEAERE